MDYRYFPQWLTLVLFLMFVRMFADDLIYAANTATYILNLMQTGDWSGFTTATAVNALGVITMAFCSLMCAVVMALVVYGERAK